jgi:hypothetical protein
MYAAHRLLSNMRAITGREVIIQPIKVRAPHVHVMLTCVDAYTTVLHAGAVDTNCNGAFCPLPSGFEQFPFMAPSASTITILRVLREKP